MPADEHGQGKALFVPFVVPGERVEATVIEEKPGFARARLEKVLEPSPRRVASGCPYYYECGGCQYQHVGYESQLEFKSEILRETMRRTAKLQIDAITTHASPPWNYRNRTRMQVRPAPQFAIGYNRFNSHELLPVRECPISSPLINRVLTAIWTLGEAANIPADAREIEFFANAEDNELIVSVIFEREPTRRILRAVAEFARALREQVPAVAGVAITTSRTPHGTSALSGHEFRGWGCQALTYRTATANYRVSAGSFFQTNRFLVNEMLSVVTSGRAGKAALDLYAGTGLFALPLAKSFEKVVAVESAASSFADLEVNGPPNLKARRSRAEEFAVSERQKFDYLVVDPPRGGLGERATRRLAAMKPAAITYVSCDPATLARDLRVLMSAGYVIRAAHLIDLFPQTFHIESILHLSL